MVTPVFQNMNLLPAAPCLVQNSDISTPCLAPDVAALTSPEQSRFTLACNMGNFGLATTPTVNLFEDNSLISAPDITRNISNEFMNVPWLELASLGVIVGATLTFDRILNAAIDHLEMREKIYYKRSLFKSVLKATRGLVWGASLFSGLSVLGVSPTSFLLAGGLSAAVIGFGFKDSLNNLGSWVAIKWRSEVKVGQHVSISTNIGEVSGVVTKITWNNIMVRATDESGVTRLYEVPPSSFINTTTIRTVIEDDVIAKIKKGDYISIGTKYYGRVSDFTKQTIGIDVLDENGTVRTVHIQKHLITKHSLRNYGKEPPPLPGGISIGDEIEVGTFDKVRGRVTDYDAFFVSLDCGNGVGAKIPRKSMSEPFRIYSRARNRFET